MWGLSSWFIIEPLSSHRCGCDPRASGGGPPAAAGGGDGDAADARAPLPPGGGGDGGGAAQHERAAQAQAGVAGLLLQPVHGVALSPSRRGRTPTPACARCSSLSKPAW